LMFEPKRAARCDDAERIAQIEPDGEISRRAADIDRRGDDGRREDSELRGGRELHAHAPEIQRQRDGRAGLKQSKFRRAADIDFAAAGKSHSRLTGVDGDYAAIHNEHAGRAGCGSVCCRRAAFDGNVIAFYAADRARWRRLLGAERREARSESSEKQEEERQASANARILGDSRASGLEISWQRTRSGFAYTIQQ